MLLQMMMMNEYVGQIHELVILSWFAFWEKENFLQVEWSETISIQSLQRLKSDVNLNLFILICKPRQNPPERPHL